MRVRVVDLLAIASVPAVLLGVFALPQSTRLALALRYVEPSIQTAYTMHFVHLQVEHLLTNVVAYLLAVPLVYLLAVLAGRRRWFYAGFVTYLAVFPFVLSGLNVILPRARIGFGFSGLNMAFLGLLPVVLTAYAGDAFGGVDLDDAPLLFFAGAALVGILTASYASAGPLVAVGAVAAGAPYLHRMVARRRLRRALRDANPAVGYAELSIGAILVFVALLVAAFPAHPVGEGSVRNVYLHVLGYAMGFIVSFATFRLQTWRRSAGQVAGPVRTDGGAASRGDGASDADRDAADDEGFEG